MSTHASSQNDQAPPSRELLVDGQLAEGSKLLFDLMKHITTISSGSIVIVGAFMKQFASSPASIPQWFVVASIFAFMLAIVTSVMSMWTLACLGTPLPQKIEVKGSGDRNTWVKSETHKKAICALASFGFGFVCIALYILTTLLF